MPPGRVLDSRSAAVQGMRSRWHCWGPTGRPVGADTAHKKRTQRRGGRRGETRRAAHGTAREKAAQARANIKEATDFEEAPPTERAKEPTRTTRTEELSEVAKRSQQHRQQAASARTVSAEDARARKTSRRAKAPTETLPIEVTTSEVTTEAAATGQRPQQQRGSHSSSSRNSEQRAAAAGQPKTCDPFRRSPPSVTDKEAPPGGAVTGGASRTSPACAPTTRHPRRRKPDGQRPCRQHAHSKRACTQGQPGHRVPTAILFRIGPPCKYGSAEQLHYKLHFISGSGHRAQGGARRSEGGVCAIIESRRCAAARNILAFR